MNSIHKYIKEKILNNDIFLGKEKERKQIRELLESTINNGESNSMLLIGPKGAGKTMLMKTVLGDLEQKCPNFHKDCIIVNLHGLVQTDDRLALKSITHQMSLDNAVDGKVFGSFAENLAFLLACLRTGEKHSSKSVIFILEEFDLFCAHHNQTLLYNLFDVSQSQQAPVCVLGITCRIDVIQLLEKRVKSRFSHRQMFLYPGPEEESSDLDWAISRYKWYLEVPTKSSLLKINMSLKKEWNDKVEALVKSKKFQSIMQRVIDLDFSEQIIKHIALKTIFNISNDDPFPTITQFENELKILEEDDTIQILKDLSVLELCLIIAMKHHCDIYDNTPANFEMIYGRYAKFACKHASMQNIKRPVVMKAFEHIQKLELISMASSVGASKLQKEYQFFKLLVTSQQVMEAINKTPGLPTEVVQWASSSLV